MYKRQIFGPVGSVLLAAVFIIACFNTCVGLISSCASYFTTLVPKLSIPAWAAFFAVVSMIIANAGLDQILAISVPILNILDPPAIVLIFLAFLPGRVQKLWAIYPVGIAFTTVASILYTLDVYKRQTCGTVTASPPSGNFFSPIFIRAVWITTAFSAAQMC